MSFGIVRFVEVTNVTDCYSVTPNRQMATRNMLQNTCKMTGFKKNIQSTKFPLGMGEVNKSRLKLALNSLLQIEQESFEEESSVGDANVY